MSRYAVYEVWEDIVPESFVYDGRLAGVLVGIAAENPLGPRPDDTRNIEQDYRRAKAIHDMLMEGGK